MIDTFMIIVSFISFVFSIGYMILSVEYLPGEYTMFRVKVIGGFTLMILSAILLCMCL